VAKKKARPEPTITQDLSPLRNDCPHCGQLMWADYSNRRAVATLAGLTRLNLTVRRCHNASCSAHLRPYRPEAEGKIALPHHEFGLDVVALVGALRYREHRSVPEIHTALRGRGLAVSQRSVSNLLDRYDELLAIALADDSRLKRLLADQGKVVLAIDGLQPDVGHEVLWVIRDCISGEILLAKSLLSARQQDLAALLGEVKARLDEMAVPVAGVVSDGQHSIRKAVAKALPGVPHQLCHFHYLREAARPIYEADRNAKKRLKKEVRGVRKIERSAERREDAEAEVILGYCSAVRGALTDDGRPPLAASGLKLRERLTAVSASLGRVAEQRGLPAELAKLKGLIDRGLRSTAALWPAIALAFAWVHKAASILGAEGAEGSAVRRRLGGLLGAVAVHRLKAGRLAGAVGHFLKVSRSYWGGLFACYDTEGVPRTNNALEQLFGSRRYHERRASGRKAGSPALVLRGAARLVAAVATRQRPFTADDLAGADRAEWARLRRDLDVRRARRTERRRFRRDPEAYLRDLEARLIQSGLPA
jgi:Transposase, Mutator family